MTETTDTTARRAGSARRTWWWNRHRSSARAAAPRVRMRMLYPGDPAVAAVFDGLSPDSRRLRFHRPVPRMTDALARRLHHVDEPRHAGVVAEVRTPIGIVPAGIARLACRDSLGAEIAVEVVERWQGRGIGLRLLGELGEVARTYGYRELYADVLRDDVRTQRLLRRAFPGSSQHRAGPVVRVSCPLDWAAMPPEMRALLADLAAR